jgi:hypothetical protein
LGPDAAPAGALTGAHRLAEACRAPGCPLCRALRAAAVGDLAAFLGEHVTDPGARARLSAAGGFCASHAALLREVSDAALGVAIVYEALVADARRWVTGARAGARRGGLWRGLGPRRRPSAAPPPGPPCPACAEAPHAEGRLLAALLDGLAGRELEDAYRGSDGLCLPHLRRAVTRAAGHPGLGPLLDHAHQRLSELAAALRGFIATHDHRATMRPTAAEAASWTRALAALAGPAGPPVP